MKHRFRRRWRWRRARRAAAVVRRAFGTERETDGCGDVGADRGVDQCGDLHLLMPDPPVGLEPGRLEWVRLRRGSQWHRAGSRCAARSRDVVLFRGAVPPRDGGYVVCLECAQLAGCGEQAAAYVPPRWATPQGLRGAGGSRSGFVAPARSPTRKDRSRQERFPAGASCREPMQRLSA